MEFVRQIIDGSQFNKIVLPENFRDMLVEVTIIPLKSKKEIEKKYTVRDLIGALNDGEEYVLTEELMQKEKEAWAEAMVDKYADR